MADEVNENEQSETTTCNFCDDVDSELLIHHKGSYICDKCVKLCYSIVFDYDSGCQS